MVADTAPVVPATIDFELAVVGLAVVPYTNPLSVIVRVAPPFV